MSEVKITYETLFALLRREKSREELQELDTTFFEDVKNYLNEKTSMMKRQEGSLTAFMDNEKEKEEQQVTNIKRIIKELYERREKKIVEVAINKSRTRSNIVNDAAMMTEEKLLFEFLTSTLDKFREGILINLLEGKQVSLNKEEKTKETTNQETTTKTTENKTECNGTEQKQGITCLRFKDAVPQFLGKELEKYGPFEEGDQTELPQEIANILISKGRAEEISKNPA